MKKISFLIFLATLISCQYFDKQIPSEKDLLKKRLEEINWNKVDKFPSIISCDEILDENQQKQCFFEFLTQTIQEKISVDTLAVLYPNLDTIQVKVTVFPDATMTFEPEFPTDSINYDRSKIDSILRVKLVDFPKVNPAVKRGIPVKTQFILPVIIKTEN